MTKTKQNLVIIGAGGLGLEVAGYAEDIAAAHGHLTIRGFLDDTKPAGTMHAGHKVLGTIDSYVPEDGDVCIIAMGEPDHRRTVTQRLLRRGAQFTNLLHPLAYISRTAQLGEGCIVSPHATVAAEARLGQQVFINVGAVVGHQANVGDYSSLSPSTLLLGHASVGEQVFMGSLSVVTVAQKVGNNCRVSAGSVIYNDIPAHARVLGNPAVFKIND